MQSVDLTGHFLIAMPNMADPHFAKTLTYVCEHNEHGALGVVVNRPIDMTVQALFEQVDIELQPKSWATSGCISAVQCRWTGVSCCISR